jgi:tetratricopeptide (TPR) repeat protein
LNISVGRRVNSGVSSLAYYREEIKMSNDLNDQAIELMKAGRFAEAIPLFRKAIELDPSHWGYWYMAGQCCRFLNELENAVTYLKKAVALKSDEPSVLLALGITLQLTNRFNEAIDAFRKAIEINPDYELAYNSLALTQKKQGKLELALHNYDAGVKALTRRIVKGMRNDRSSKIFKHRNFENQLWMEYCTFGAMYLCALSGNIEGMAWPTGEQAMEEERTERHGGLYWVDRPNSEGKLTRLFLPNYFNTFREMLRQDRAYADFIGNRGTVLEQLGRRDEANQHFEEAEYFLP